MPVARDEVIATRPCRDPGPSPAGPVPCSTPTALDGLARLLERVLPGQADRVQQLLRAAQNRAHPPECMTPAAPAGDVVKDPLWTVCLQQLRKLGFDVASPR